MNVLSTGSRICNTLTNSCRPKEEDKEADLFVTKSQMKYMQFINSSPQISLFTIDCTDTDFTGSIFKSILFEARSFKGSIFKQCTFINCSFRDVDGSQINFEECIFEYTTFFKCMFENSIFTNSKFIKCYFNKDFKTISNLISYLLEDEKDNITCIFTGSNFTKAIFINCYLYQINLTNTNLSNGAINNSQLINVILNNTNFTCTSFDTVYIKPYMLQNANFHDATFTQNCQIDLNRILDLMALELEYQKMDIKKTPLDLHLEFLTTISTINGAKLSLTADIIKVISNWFYNANVNITTKVFQPLYNNPIYLQNVTYKAWILYNFATQFRNQTKEILQLQSSEENNDYWLPHEIIGQILYYLVLSFTYCNKT